MELTTAITPSKWNLRLEYLNSWTYFSFLCLVSFWVQIDSIKIRFNNNSINPTDGRVSLCVYVRVPGLLLVFVMLNGCNWSGVVHDICVLHADAFFCTFANQMDFFRLYKLCIQILCKMIFIQIQSGLNFTLWFDLTCQTDTEKHIRRTFGSHILRNFSTYFIECGNKKTGRTAQQQRRFVLTAF